jgi:hypothetical protein
MSSIDELLRVPDLTLFVLLAGEHMGLVSQRIHWFVLRLHDHSQEESREANQTLAHSRASFYGSRAHLALH